MGRRKGQIAAMANLQLVKDRHRSRPNRQSGNDSFLHTTELDDGTTYNRINFQSVTEQNNLEEFLNTAEMAGRDFTAERQAVQIISNPGQYSHLTNDDYQKINDAQESHRKSLQIPRRPPWDETTTKEELILAERESFTNWRRQLKMLEEEEHIQLTPYEKNLDFWRQLWRVIERSDVVVQIVDARNPLLFRCEDLEIYVKEVDPKKTCMLLINKADFLSQEQRQLWVNHFNKESIRAVFFSAMMEKEKQEKTGNEEIPTKEQDNKEVDEAHSSPSCSDEEEVSTVIDPDKDLDTEQNLVPDKENHSSSDKESANDLEVQIDSIQLQTCDKAKDFSSKDMENQVDNFTATESINAEKATSHSTSSTAIDSFHSDSDIVSNSPNIVSSDELLDIFRKLAHPSAVLRQGTDEVRTVGMVGYPNVGKSSTINVILEQKRLAVSATPGRTKHLQTLFVDKHLMLCDCPGLVFPSFVATKPHLVINGILPIDELRSHVPPVSLVCEHIPRSVLESTYSIMIPRPSLDDVNPNRIPTAEELLNAYGAMRGFMNARGVPDCPRASRYILKDYVKGKLLYCEPPPGTDGPSFQDQSRVEKLHHKSTVKARLPQIRSDIDDNFFTEKRVKAHSRGVKGVKDHVRTDTLQATSRMSSAEGSELTDSLSGSMASLSSQATSVLGGKPWKKHQNRNKKEKLRRVYRDLDVH